MMGLFRSLIIIMMLMVIFTPQTTVKADPPVHESEYNWGNLRIDINNLNTVDDYRIQIKTTNYVPTTTN